MTPDILDDDIYEVCNLLGLPRYAFHGEDGKDPRQEVLKSHETIDINACPGSGKTTLLVAKLALLARSWPYRTRGICVLSHTNAARDEIEKKLGSTSEGQSLLGYPHFVGTIHKFVDQFLAIPFLRSLGNQPNIIDKEFALDWRWNQLDWRLREGLSTNRAGKNTLEMNNIDGGVSDINWGRGTLGTHTLTYQNIVDANLKSIEQGFFTYDEMFLWAKESLNNANVIQAVNFRFPYIFIDEAQDNSELQSSLLSELFSVGRGLVVRQRFGDENQAIYNYSGQDGAATDPFPFDDRTKVKELPNSHRFGQEIAGLANSFTSNRLTAPLVGSGPNISKGNPDSSNKHTVLLFEESEILEVLPTYADIILQAYNGSSSIIENGDFVAVGAVHKSKENMKGFPHYIGHYFPAYDAAISKKEAKPTTFLEYIYRAQNESKTSNSTFALVEAFNEAIIRCIHISGRDATGLRKTRKCKHIRENLNKHSRLHNLLMLSLIKPNFEFDEKNWTARWVNAIKAIVRDIDDAVNFTNLNDFLTWVPPMPSASKKEAGTSKNLFVFNGDKGEEIKVRLGSIHSVKGQTHTATLILDTFKDAYHFKQLKKCITQKGFTDKQRTNSLLDRMKLHYVAATRPTHLLCIAARKDHFTEKEIVQIQDSGMWKVTVLSGK